MLVIPEEIKDLFRSDNRTKETHKKFKLTFYNESVESLYPYESLYPEESLFPSEYGAPWLTIENDRIISESLKITESLSSDEDMAFGSCEGTEIQITVADVIEDVTNKEFTLTVEIGGYEMALGIYTVKSFQRESDRRKRKITAYDRMSWFDVDVADWYNTLTFPTTIKAFRDSLCEYIGIEQEQISLLFDTMQISKTIEPEQLSGLDVLKAICEINGCFGHVNKTGMLTYVHLQQTGLYPAETLYPEESLYPSEFGGDGMPVETVSTYKQPMTYEDYLVEGISSITIRQEEGDIGANVGNGENVYTIEGNFLVYGKNASELLNIATSLLNYTEGRMYRPAKVNCNCMPWIEVGDALRIPTKNDIVETFVMKRTISGCQNMRDEIESTGNQKFQGEFGIHKQIKQLEGKTAVISRNVDSVSATVTDLKEYTEANFEITAQNITAEVQRATAAEGQLSAQISINAENIALKVSKGEVSSQISIESGGVNITGNRLTWSATNSSMSSDGTLICQNIKATNGEFSGTITGSTVSGTRISGGRISVGYFYANDDEMSFGSFAVTDGGNTIQGPGGIEMGTGPDGMSDGYVRTYMLQCYDVSFDHDYAEGMTAIEMFEQLYDYSKESRQMIYDLEDAVYG